MAENGERTIETESDPGENPASDQPEASQQDHQDNLTARDTTQEPITPSSDQIERKQAKNADESTRERDVILDASLHLFAEKGVYQTSLVDISVYAQVSKTVLYKQFQNKEAIADALYKDLTERLDQTLADIHKNSSTSIGCLRSIVEFLLDLTDQAPDVSRLLFCPKDSGLHNKPGSEWLPAYTCIVEILNAGMNSGELERTDPKLAYCTFMGPLSYVINLYLEGELGAPLDQHTSDIWYPVWRALGKNPNRAN